MQQFQKINILYNFYVALHQHGRVDNFNHFFTTADKNKFFIRQEEIPNKRRCSNYRSREGISSSHHRLVAFSHRRFLAVHLISAYVFVVEYMFACNPSTFVWVVVVIYYCLLLCLR